MAPEQQIDSNEWVSKDEAAGLLGVSPRQIERLAFRGAIAKHTLPKAPAEKAARVVYSREDIERVKAGVSSPVVSPAVSNEPALAETTAPAVTIDRADTLVALVSRLAAGVPAIPAPRPWLDLSEASERSGLTRSWLLREAESGTSSIAIRDMGKHARGGRWRFHSASLSEKAG